MNNNLKVVPRMTLEEKAISISSPKVARAIEASVAMYRMNDPKKPVRINQQTEVEPFFGENAWMDAQAFVAIMKKRLCCRYRVRFYFKPIPNGYYVMASWNVKKVLKEG